jgi:nucleoid DNA-binding protein
MSQQPTPPPSQPPTLTRPLLAERIVQSDGSLKPAEAANAVGLVLEALADHLAEGGAAELRGLGSFRWVERKARTGRVPLTGEVVPIPARRELVFRPGKCLGPRAL